MESSLTQLSLHENPSLKTEFLNLLAKNEKDTNCKSYGLFIIKNLVWEEDYPLLLDVEIC